MHWEPCSQLKLVGDFTSHGVHSVMYCSEYIQGWVWPMFNWYDTGLRNIFQMGNGTVLNFDYWDPSKETNGCSVTIVAIRLFVNGIMIGTVSSQWFPPDGCVAAIRPKSQKWAYFVVTRSADTVSLFINGSLKLSADNVPGDVAGSLEIGYNWWGQMSDFRS